jgi:hypothetical protein
MPKTTTKGDALARELERGERFRRIASHRANRSLGYIEALMRTADKSRYEYTDKQVGEILGKLRQATDQLEAAYSSKSKGLQVEL